MLNAKEKATEREVGRSCVGEAGSAAREASVQATFDLAPESPCVVLIHSPLTSLSRRPAATRSSPARAGYSLTWSSWPHT